MTNVYETIFDCSTGKTTQVLITPELESKVAEQVKNSEELSNLSIAEEAVLAVKKEALLARLGITADEAKLLLA